MNNIRRWNCFLYISAFKWLYLPEKVSANFFTDFKDARSKSIVSIFAFGAAKFFTIFAAFKQRLAFRQAITTFAFFLASIFAEDNPNPTLAPVIIITRPV